MTFPSGAHGSIRGVAALAGVLVAVCVPAAGDAKAKTKTFSSGDLAEPIPSRGYVPVAKVRATKRGRVKDVNVAVRLDYPYDGYLSLALDVPPPRALPHDPPTILLSRQNGGDGDNYGTGATGCASTFSVFDDQATTPITAGAPPFDGSFIPEQRLSLAKGESIRGSWRLLTAGTPPYTGTLYCFQVTITYRPP